MRMALGMILSCLAVVAGAQPHMEAKTFETLQYRIHVPEGLESGQTVPLVLFLHGAGERGDDNAAQLVHGVKSMVDYSVRTKQPLILLAPQCPKGSGWGGRRNQTKNPLSLALELVEQTKKSLPVDADRVYITGLSMGGYGTWTAIAQKPDLFAAAIPICGGGSPDSAGELVSVPVWAFHGGADGTVPPERSRVMIAAIQAAGGWPRYTEYPGVGHNSWTRTYADDVVLDWLLSQRLSQRNQWETLFNGKDLTGWTPKIKGYDLGVNFGNTFRVEDGLLKVVYDQYEKFESRFGHLFYKEPLSRYILRVEYRFVGEQIPGGPGWALRNSGIMIHGQAPETMGKDQDFPVSIEVQTLGGNGSGKRSTGNLCTPGTNVVSSGKLYTPHIINSSSETYHGSQWVRLEIEAQGSEYIKHLVNGRVVLTYQEPQLDPKAGDAKKLIKDGKLLISGGSISLQSESHPVEYRRVELLKL
ncbi:MAG: DUF1080 domain-containing protein [Phycisphaeraceae bacterium]|nr:DUF1080 domain-containing protein [Phycisphaeraceae bacterium]